ncbi:hypothetical protein L596_025279 [Steinernema carpocapsae]|uniref:Uncharacterized protein n=1 Tax=Steinernema carpocapsae TaxID=34508 RepID=A0A4U5M7C3_STECR|nr:hypothetical protein L596_025279 [Steinernema carpocapsae]
MSQILSLCLTIFASVLTVRAQFGFDYNPYMAYGGYGGGYGMGGMGGYGGMYNPLMYPQNAAVGNYGAMMNPFMGGYPGFMGGYGNMNGFSSLFNNANYQNSGNANSFSNMNRNNPMFSKRLSSNTLNQNVQSGSSLGSNGCRTPFCFDKTKAAKN